MNETLKQKIMYEKALYLKTVENLKAVENKIMVLEQKYDDGIITTKEKQILVHLYLLEMITLDELSKLYE